MTFTLVGRCERTGQLGIGIATSTIAVASRCSFIRPHVGAVATQAYADPGLGVLGLNLLEVGFSPPGVIEELRANDEWFEYRQIGIMTESGISAVRTGAKNPEWKGHLRKPDHIAMGNHLAGPTVIEHMSEAFASSAGELLEERLMRAIEAGTAAGGDKNGQISAGLLSYGRAPFPRTDLRIDLQEMTNEDPRDAVAALRELFDGFQPLIEYYELKPTNPTMPTWREWMAKTSR